MSSAAPPPDSPTATASSSDAAAQGVPRKPHTMGNWRSLVISMLVLLGFIGLWLAFSPRISHVEQRAVDVAAVARQIQQDEGLTVSVPALSDPWKPTSARYTRSSEGLMTWEAGYHVVGDDSTFAGIRQTRADGDPRAIEEWLVSATSGGRQEGAVDVGGATWTRYTTDGEPARRALVAQGQPLLTVVEGLATYEQLAEVAGALRPSGS